MDHGTILSVVGHKVVRLAGQVLELRDWLHLVTLAFVGTRHDPESVPLDDRRNAARGIFRGR